MKTTPHGQTATTGGARRATAPSHTPPNSRTIVVLDTSVVMTDPNAHLDYSGCDVVIPLTVIDELDQNKTRADAPGRNAREFLRTIEALRTQCGGDIRNEFTLPGDATLRIEPNGLHLEELTKVHLAEDKNDHRIIAAALGLADITGRPVRVISNDTALRVKAAVCGLDAAEHAPGNIGVHAPSRTGYHEVALSADAIDAIKTAGHAGVQVSNLAPEDEAAINAAGVIENEFIWASGTAVTARYSGGSLRPTNKNYRPWGAVPRNKEQAFALDLLADNSVTAVALRGHAGTGKTLCAIAAGLEAVIEKRTHNQLVILRPMVSVGHQDIGFLPGDVAEKTAPWFDAVIDVLIALSAKDDYGRDVKRLTYKEAKELLDAMIAEGQVVLAPVTFLRGRTFHKTFLILDEAQNVSQTVVKTVASRLGEGSRLVLNGDDGQIDVPFSSALTCGLNVAVDAFAGEDLFGQIVFTKGERSRLADLAAERL